MIYYKLVSFTHCFGDGLRGCPCGHPLLVSMAKLKTNVYVDGFNLYYGAVNGTPYKWLNIDTLLQLMLPMASINRIRYFTALVNSTLSDPTKRQRQQTYIRALETIPHLKVAYGNFMSEKKRMPLVQPLLDGTTVVEVIRTEEKGSDVNLAAYMVYDACQGEYQQAIVVSNDTDLAEAISLVHQRLGLRVGIINPRKNTAWPLRNAATFYRSIRTGVLSASQFPNTLSDVYGTITKPPSW